MFMCELYKQKVSAIMTNVIMFVDKGQATFCAKRDKHKKGIKDKTNIQTITGVSLPTQNHS